MVRKILMGAYTLLWIFIITIVGFCIVWAVVLYGLFLFIFYIFYRLVMKGIDICRFIIVNRWRRRNQNDDEQ